MGYISKFRAVFEDSVEIRDNKNVDIDDREEQ